MQITFLKHRDIQYNVIQDNDVVTFEKNNLEPQIPLNFYLGIGLKY